jgi:hypothetical protein
MESPPESWQVNLLRKLISPDKFCFTGLGYFQNRYNCCKVIGMRRLCMAIPLIVSLTLLSGCGDVGIRKGDILELKPAASKTWVEGVAHHVLLRVNLKRNSVDRWLMMQEGYSLPEITILTRFQDADGLLSEPLEQPFVKDC